MRFLDFLAEEFLSTKDQSHVPKIIVFPSRRAAELFKQKTSVKIQQPILFPELLTTEQYIERVSGMKIDTGPSLWLNLYEVYQKVIDRPEKPELFLSWCTTLLSDFNEIDLHLLDHKAFFSYLNEARALEVWNLNRSPLPDFQQHYLHFWNQLPSLYEAFSNICNENKRAYRGLCTRIASEHISKLNPEPVWFCGFNMLSPAEEQIIDTALKRNGRIYWETDPWFYEDIQHEAGSAIRKFHKRWKESQNSILFSQSGMLNSALHIESTGCPGVALQVYEALASVKKSDQSCVIVLGDDRFLEPVLHLAGRMPEVNISGGLSLLNFPIVTSILQYLDICLHAPEEQSINQFLNKQLVFGHLKPAIKQFLRQEEKEKNRPLPAELKEFFMACDRLHQKSFHTGFVKDWIQALQLLMDDMRGTALLCLTAIDAMLPELEAWLRHPAIGSTYSRGIFTFLVNTLAQNQTLTIPGKKGSNIEIIGMLETRCLSFDRLILLGCNEGILPASAGGTSFIPYDVRKQFHLPGIAEKESVFSYHFFRLVSGSKSVNLYYNSQGNDFGGGEPSRYLLQLKHEWLPERKKLHLEGGSILEKQIKQGGVMEPAPEIRFRKSKETIKKIAQKLFTDGLSPSAFNMMRACHLKFYYRYVIHLKDETQPSYSIDQAELGTLVHAVFEHILPVGSRDKSLDFDSIQQNLKKNIESTAKKNFPESNFDSGANYLLLHWTYVMISGRLKEEARWFKESKDLMITGCEKELDQSIPFNDTYSLKLKSKIDRIQETSDAVYVLDYKTGKVEDKDLNQYEDPEEWKEASDKCVQLAFYCMLTRMEHAYRNKQIYPAFIALRSKSNSLCMSQQPWNENAEHAFKEYLVHEINILFNEDTPIVQTNDLKNCEYCEFSVLCRR